MAGRNVLGEEFLKGGGAGVAYLSLLVVRAGLVVEVAEAGDVGVLKGIGPGAELAGAGLGDGFEI